MPGGWYSDIVERVKEGLEQPTNPTIMGKSGGDQAAAGFELPEQLQQQLRQGVTPYEMPLSLEMLLYGGGMAGQWDIAWGALPPLDPRVGYKGRTAESMGIPQEIPGSWWRNQLRANPQLEALVNQLFTPQQFAKQKGIKIGATGGFTYEGIKWSGGRGKDAYATIAQHPDYYEWKKQMGVALARSAGRARSGFLPDKAAYMGELQGTLEEYAAQLGIRREAFQTDVAGRGIGPGGAGTSPYYQDVVAPVMRAGAQAVRGSFLDYLKAYQQGSIAAEGFRQQDISRLTGTELAVGQMEQTTRSQNLNRLLEGYLGQGQLDLGFQNLALESRVANKEFAFRSYENKLKVWMFREEMRQRERESQRSFWGDFFGDLFEAGGKAAGA